MKDYDFMHSLVFNAFLQV
uniref:Uncharacterized protein n=1 Tax=Anguilla anguilla TaxID=7936 RepID=A0A0E9W5D5_ANGAN